MRSGGIEIMKQAFWKAVPGLVGGTIAPEFTEGGWSSWSFSGRRQVL